MVALEVITAALEATDLAVVIVPLWVAECTIIPLWAAEWDTALLVTEDAAVVCSL